MLVIRNTAREDDEAVRAQYAELKRIVVQNPVPYFNVIDTGGGGVPNPHRRKLIAELTRDIQPHADLHCRGTAIVVDSPLMRGLMTAMLWLMRPSRLTQPCATLDDAVAFAARKLADAGNGRAS